MVKPLIDKLCDSVRKQTLPFSDFNLSSCWPSAGRSLTILRAQHRFIPIHSLRGPSIGGCFFAGSVLSFASLVCPPSIFVNLICAWCKNWFRCRHVDWLLNLYSTCRHYRFRRQVGRSSGIAKHNRDTLVIPLSVIRFRFSSSSRSRSFRPKCCAVMCT